MSLPGPVDLLVEPEDDSELPRIARLAREMGYVGLGVELGHYDPMRKAGASANFQVYPVLKVIASGKGEVAKALSRAPGRALVMVLPRGLEAYRYAARARRVDLVQAVPRAGLMPDRSTLNLFRAREGGALTLPLRPLLDGEMDLGDVREVALRALRRGIRLVIVSGARRAEELWHPSQVIGLLASLGLPPAFGLLALTSGPGFVLSRRGLAAPKGVLAEGP